MNRREQMSHRQPKRVLLVDDEPSVREMLADFLELNNFICMQAANGEAAVDYTKREKFDLVIMDIRMPGVSGIEALRTIKEDIPDQPVVMVTAVNEVETAVEAMRLGAYDYVMKPFILRDMLLVIEHAITGQGQQFDHAPEPDVFDVPMTIAVGTPMVDDSEEMRDELFGIVETINSIQDQLAKVANRVDALLPKQLRMLPPLEQWPPVGSRSA
ncbi:MAG: response regulator [Chloroflexi bacterium]|nr:response regulator [Chloroflexota bacterium]